ncbi:hypothetical protein A3B21_03735 [Candidatus Uhrbacteria bacterium RIFCSPLOWO2_01_FULL_47_24]|uniref:PEP-utilising enzyme mobile domain-containing protein n=1 Tax=Candidatus Uhrbacteria bacterium RIFCSPLOWO2_01_FULL_47_24 TaxID=1802401 RepID=A0A1F7URD5_9BACT|nr:MAG: hypothetical protein A2753_01460 [Candidatus Uhrbacteria bacterium RIFCSPHIGHO2_01_FULL_47_11]OGL68543.1 MAG: hypothetical protein A3D58_02335 [Candidatus Uhrbacteria bacterium RIFCSPHIGHO2_02_FULL_46_47]OGL75480.1 MAG: hypothetical protein A3F52_04210 [Candidatus Uhrbacteria bacterium RIFCSPHIGHO2_12_FULL_47_11]OGL80851.1 MAG: hypothetical protein A3B21_03735 [Candidatus Uhrbacteria bacterium RIFCSPLOWO2_01_FULL_47_24]OGL84749.1 MAG: hypothetical protein A3J03_01090 [Candidatus Uhrbact
MAAKTVEYSWIKNVKWVKVKERDIDIALESFYTKGYEKKYFKKIGINFGISNQLVFSDGRIYFDQQDIDSTTHLLLEKKDKLSKYALKVTNHCVKQLKKCEQFLKKHKKTNFSKISDGSFKKICSEFIEVIYSLIPQAFFVSEILEKVASEKIIASLKNHTSDPVSLYTKLVIPTQPSRLSREYVERLALALKLQQKNSIDHGIKKYLNKFGWVALYSPIDDLYTKEKILTEIKKLSEKSNLADELKQAKRKEIELKKIAAQAWRTVKLPAHDHLLIKVMQKNAWVRTYRRELISEIFFQMRPMYIKCARKLNLKFSDLRQVACWEIIEQLNNPEKNFDNMIEERKSGYVFLQQKNEVQIISGESISKIFDPEKNSTINAELKGLPVYHGQAVGPVKIIHKKEDLASFKKGEVLVAPTVGTWMMPAVEKCIAIITDAGGVLSHTAIVAREFKKPCIVATKHATKILKNGQIVTIDTQLNLIKLK